MRQSGRRAVLSIGVTIIVLFAAQSTAIASSPSVSGGGVVDGALGTTSQLGFNASSAGGQFLCVMAGRSGGFPFGPWDSIQQMRVEGPVEPASLSVSGGVASFSGTATVHVVGRTVTGDVMTATVTVSYTSRQTAGGAGVATHRLEVTFQDGSHVSFPGLGMEPLRSGHITINP